MYPTAQSPPMPAQQPIVIAIPQNLPNVDAHLSRQLIANGILQIIVGVICILLNSVLLGIGVGWGISGLGFCGGVFYIVTGSLGIVAGKKMTKCLMIAHMVLCIIAASLIAPGHFTVSVLGALAMGYRLNYSYYSFYIVSYIIEIIHAVLVVIEFAFAVWGSTIWCQTYGCCSDQQGMAAVQAVQMINGQPIILVQGHRGQLAPVVTQQPQCPSYPMPAPSSYAKQEKNY